MAEAQENPGKSFCTTYSKYQDVEVYDEGEMVDEGLTCSNCKCLNIPNRKCQQCSFVYCVSCIKVMKHFNHTYCLKCNAPLDDMWQEDPSILEKLLGLDDMKCPRRNCSFRGPFATTIEHFNSCITRKVCSESRYSLSSVSDADSGTYEVYLVENQNCGGSSYQGSISAFNTSSRKRSSSGSKVCGLLSFKCLKAQKSVEEPGRMTSEDILANPLPPSGCYDMVVPDYPYKCSAKFEDGEISVCIPRDNKEPLTLWKPPYWKLKCDIVVTPNKGSKIKCYRQAEELFGTQIFNDGHYHFRIRIDKFMKKLRQARANEQEKMPCDFFLRWKKPSVPDEVKHGRECMIIKNLAGEILKQENNDDQLYSDYWFGKPEPLRCRASLYLEDPHNHQLLFRVFTMDNDYQYKKIGMVLEFSIAEIAGEEEDDEVIKEHCKERLYLHGFHTVYSLSRQDFWRDLCSRKTVFKIDFYFHAKAFNE